MMAGPAKTGLCAWQGSCSAFGKAHVLPEKTMLSQELLPDSPSPVAVPPGHDGLSRAMKDVLSAESDFVAKFLQLQGMTHLPAGFPAFANWHHGQLGEEVSWE